MEQDASFPSDDATRRVIFALLLFALGTMFLPVLTSTPAANGRAERAATDFVVEMLAGALPLRSGLYTLGLIWLTYASLSLALLLVWTPKYHKPIGLIALLGLVTSSRSGLDAGQFASVLRQIEHAPGAGVDFQIAFHPAAYALWGLLALVLLLLWQERSTD